MTDCVYNDKDKDGNGKKKAEEQAMAKGLAQLMVVPSNPCIIHV